MASSQTSQAHPPRSLLCCPWNGVCSKYYLLLCFIPEFILKLAHRKRTPWGLSHFFPLLFSSFSSPRDHRQPQWLPEDERFCLFWDCCGFRQILPRWGNARVRWAGGPTQFSSGGNKLDRNAACVCVDRCSWWAPIFFSCSHIWCQPSSARTSGLLLTNATELADVLDNRFLFYCHGSRRSEVEVGLSCRTPRLQRTPAGPQITAVQHIMVCKQYDSSPSYSLQHAVAAGGLFHQLLSVLKAVVLRETITTFLIWS